MATSLLVGFCLLQTTWVVDDSGGLGVDFTDIPPAIAAAADGDLLLVKAGTYSHFTLTGKGLRILGEGAGSTFVSFSPSATGTSISAVPAGSTVTIDRMKFSLGTTPTLSILGGGSTATLADVAIEPALAPCSFPGPNLVIEGALVHIHRSTVLGRSGCTAISGGPALQASGGALVHVSSSTIRGGTGGTSISLGTSFAGWGGSGAVALSAPGTETRLWIADSDVRGGAGGMAFAVNTGGGGGAAIVVQSSVLRLSGGPHAFVQGGAGGGATLGACGAGGAGIASSGGATGWVHGVTVLAGSNCGSTPTTPAVLGSGIALGQPPLPFLEVSGSLSLSGSATISLSNSPSSSIAVIALDTGPAHFGLPGPFLGELLLGPPPSDLFLVGAPDPSGLLSVTVPLAGLPSTLAHLPFHLQGAALDGGGSWRLSNATVAVLRP